MLFERCYKRSLLEQPMADCSTGSRCVATEAKSKRSWKSCRPRLPICACSAAGGPQESRANPGALRRGDLLPLSVGSRCPLGSTMPVMRYWGGASCSCAGSADGSLLERCACRRVSDSGGDCYTECDTTCHYGKGTPPQRPNWRSGGPERCPCMGVSRRALAVLRLRSTGALVGG